MAGLSMHSLRAEIFEPPKTKLRGAQRTVYVLVALLLAGFGLALLLQIDAQRRTSSNHAAFVQVSSAQLLAEQVNAGLVHGWGALAGAAEMARIDASISDNAGAVLQAAARARPISGGAILDRQLRVISATDSRAAKLAQSVAAEIGSETAWGGVGQADGRRAPVLARRVNGAIILSIIDPVKLLPETANGSRAIITDGAFSILASSPQLTPEETSAFEKMLKHQAVSSGSFTAKVEGGEGIVVGVAKTGVGDLHVYALRATTPPLRALLGSALQFLLLAAAPALAVSALLLLQRQNARRARDAEEEVERVERRFRLAADGARAGLFEWRDDTNTINLSEQLAGLLRAPREELSLAEFFALPPAEDRAALEAAFGRARETGALDVSFRIAATHAVVFVEMRGLAIEAAGERNAPRIVGTAIDVSARKEAEIRAAALQRRLRDAIDSFTGPFALFDARKRLLLWNKSFQTCFQLDTPTLRPGASYDTIAIASAAHVRRERVDATDSQSREVELATGAWLQIQERRTIEGGLVIVGIDITPIKRQEEVLTKSEATLKAAVTKLETSEGRNRELARSYEEQKRRAEAASRAKSAFLANMSHELRTPLNAVIGFSEIMAGQLFGPLGDERYHNYSKDIHASGQLLLDLINDILDMAKIEAGKLNLAPRPLDPLDAIEQAVRFMKRRAEEKGLQLIVDAPDLPEIEADHRAVKQMLLNLLSNAVKFTEKGGVMVEGRANETHIILRVVDTGRGIPREHLPRLARPFEQVETEFARDHAGTGLGLALTKSLAEMHGGRFEIDSEVGKGTVATITLPRTAAITKFEDTPIAAE
jgi:two-component system cell cycle sensor histidine kinase PleC